MSHVETTRGTGVLEDPEQEYCYGHPKTPTKLHCSRCDRPICGQCAIPASVGQHCPECVAEARKSVRKPKSVLRASAPAVWALIIVNVAVYVLEIVLGDAFIQRFFSFGPAIADGQWYRMFTAMFLHAPLDQRFGLFHILFNMYILSIYGPNVEQVFGTLRFVAMYFLAGLAGSVASYAFGTCVNPSLGASGAIFGVVGMLVMYLYRRRGTAMMDQYLRGMVFFVGINLVFGFVVSGIDYNAHIGGLVGGLALGAGFDRGDPKSPKNLPVQIATYALVLGVIVAVAVWRTATFSCF